MTILKRIWARKAEALANAWLNVNENIIESIPNTPIWWFSRITAEIDD
jgi:hypothetical protein